MAIAAVAGTTASATASATCTVTIPAGASAGNLMIMVVAVFTLSSSAPSVSFSGAGGSWAQVGTTQVSAGGGIWSYGYAFSRTATSGDPGAALTLTESGSAAGSTWWAVAMEAYSGASAVDVISGTSLTGQTVTSINAPTTTTGADAEWGVQVFAGGVGNFATLTRPSTSRQGIVTADGIGAAISDTNASAGNSGSSIGGGTFSTNGAASSFWPTAFTLSLQPAGSSPHAGLASGTGAAGDATVMTVAHSGTSGAVDTYAVTWPGNGGEQDMLVIAPSAPSTAYDHAYLWFMPVLLGQDTTYGDPVALAQSLGIPDAYNLTCMFPAYGNMPWFADNPSDATVRQETFSVLVANWALAHLGSGAEKHYLVGFSKSGTGVLQLVFRNPSVYYKAAAWDFVTPTAYDQYDGSAAAYGNQVAFAANYELASGNVAGWRDAADFASQKRLWLGGYNLYQSQVEAFDTLLTTDSVLHDLREVAASSHGWQPGTGAWLASAVAAMLGTRVIAGTAAGTGTGRDATAVPARSAPAGLAAGTGTANSATVGVPGLASAPAGVAAGTGTARGAGIGGAITFGRSAAAGQAASVAIPGGQP